MSSIDNHSLKQTTTFPYLTKFNGLRSKSLKIQQVIITARTYLALCTPWIECWIALSLSL